MTWTDWQAVYGEEIQRRMRTRLRGNPVPTLEQIMQAAEDSYRDVVGEGKEEYGHEAF